MGQPCKPSCHVEERHCELPSPEERIDKHYIPGEGHEEVIHDVRIFEPNDVVSDVMTREEKEFSVSIELNCL